jgi:hypothetical protein
VHVQHGPFGDLAVARFAPYQHGRDLPFPVGVGAQLEDRLRVTVAEVVRLPLNIRHDSALYTGNPVVVAGPFPESGGILVSWRTTR